jgi:hypothetical protein
MHEALAGGNGHTNTEIQQSHNKRRKEIYLLDLSLVKGAHHSAVAERVCRW